MDRLPTDYKLLVGRFGKERSVCDYIAGMPAQYAVRQCSDICIPKGWNG